MEMNNLIFSEIINEYNGKVKYDFLPKIIDKCLEIEHVENAHLNSKICN